MGMNSVVPPLHICYIHHPTSLIFMKSYVPVPKIATSCQICQVDQEGFEVIDAGTK